MYYLVLGVAMGLAIAAYGLVALLIQGRGGWARDFMADMAETVRDPIAGTLIIAVILMALATAQDPSVVARAVFFFIIVLIFLTWTVTKTETLLSQVKQKNVLPK